MNQDDMKLPEGKKCADCYYAKRCACMFGVSPENTLCDFAPSRFFEVSK